MDHLAQPDKIDLLEPAEGSLFVFCLLVVLHRMHRRLLQSMNKLLMLSVGLFLLTPRTMAQETAHGKPLSVLDFGAMPDGTTDNTAAFTKALQAAAATGGGIVHVPTGRYSFSGSLVFPKETSLHGTSSYAPSHAGIRDKSDEKPEYRTVFLVRGGANDKTAAPFIQLSTNCDLRGVCIYYPDQVIDKPEPITYPFAIQMRGNNPAVVDVELLNPYDGIDASNNQRALIRNVHGQPLHLGIFVDGIYDIGRIENVHWNPWWSLGTPIYEWQRKNGIGFSFGRSDWHYVVNTTPRRHSRLPQKFRLSRYVTGDDCLKPTRAIHLRPHFESQ